MVWKIRYPDMQLPHVFMHFLAQFMWFPHGNIEFSLFIFSWVPKRIPRWPDMQLPHVFIALFMRDRAFPHVFITVWHPLGFLLGAHWDLLGLLLDMLEGLWSFLGILWSQHGARNIKMRFSKSILAQVEVARGSQRVSMGRFWEDVHHLFCAILVYWYI